MIKCVYLINLELIYVLHRIIQQIIWKYNYCI
jgi:hypothetical protein